VGEGKEKGKEKGEYERGEVKNKGMKLILPRDARWPGVRGDEITAHHLLLLVVGEGGR